MMNPAEFKKLLESIKDHTAPASLDLSDTLDEKQAIELIEHLKNNVSVSTLLLRRNLDANQYDRLGPPVALALSEALEENRTLHSINLVGNKVGIEGAKAFVPAIERGQIQYLCLVGNAIGKEGIEAITAAIKKSKISPQEYRLDIFGDCTEDGLSFESQPKKTPVKKTELLEQYKATQLPKSKAPPSETKSITLKK